MTFLAALVFQKLIAHTFFFGFFLGGGGGGHR